MTNVPALVSNPSKVQLLSDAAAQAPTKVLTPASHADGVVLALLLDARTTIEALRTVLKAHHEDRDYFPGHYDIDNMKATLSKLIGERVG